MRNEKNDRRVRYTKMILRQKLIELLYQKDISQVTVTELCEAADINRATFYAHFSDPYDLLTKIGEDLYSDLSDYLDEFQNEENILLPLTVIEKIFEYIQENANECRYFLSERGGIQLRKRIMELIYDKIIEILPERMNVSIKEAGYLYAFLVFGALGIVQRWLEEGLESSPKEMAAIMMDLIQGMMTGKRLIRREKAPPDAPPK